jgi:menaquinol-cytochrome c reductase iron-sulfur subunit
LRDVVVGKLAPELHVDEAGPRVYSHFRMAVQDASGPRRGFLKFLTGAIGALIGAVVAIPGLRFLATPLTKEMVTGGEEPLRVASLDQVEPGIPLRVNVVGQRNDGWLRQDSVKLGACWLTRSATGQVRAFSTVCPHLGCGIDYNDKNQKFECPCHGSFFDNKDGRCVEGPSPRGMDELDVVTSGKDIKVRYRRFRIAIGKKVPV